MANTPLSVLLTYTDGTNYTRYALKADSFIVQVSKSPIQIPVPQASPQLIDFGIFRPAITISGIVDDIGGDTSNTTSPNSEGGETAGMESFTASDGQANKTFYIPYKNKLEESLFEWMFDGTNIVTLQVGDATTPVYNGGYTTDGEKGLDNSAGHATGGGKYRVALQQVRFQVDAGREDRWIFQMQFVCESRLDTKGTVFS